MKRAAYPVLALALIAAAGCDTSTNENGTNTTTTNQPSGPNTTTNSTPPRTNPGTPANPGSSNPGSSNPGAVDPGAPVNPNSAAPPAGAAQLSDAQILSILMLKDHQEAAIGRLAQQKATSDAAKELADALVRDHTEHAQKVSDAADAAGVTLLSDDEAKAQLDRIKGGTPAPDALAELRTLSGDEFDRRFGSMMAQGHRELIQMLEAARTQIKNAGVRTLVDDTLPALRMHEEMARDITGATTP